MLHKQSKPTRNPRRIHVRIKRCGPMRLSNSHCNLHQIRSWLLIYWYSGSKSSTRSTINDGHPSSACSYPTRPPLNRWSPHNINTSPSLMMYCSGTITDENTTPKPKCWTINEAPNQSNQRSTSWYKYIFRYVIGRRWRFEAVISLISAKQHKYIISHAPTRMRLIGWQPPMSNWRQYWPTRPHTFVHMGVHDRRVAVVGLYLPLSPRIGCRCSPWCLLVERGERSIPMFLIKSKYLILYSKIFDKSYSSLLHMIDSTTVILSIYV